MPVLDSPLLQATLRDELRAAWNRIREAYPSDPLYGFGVFTTDSASYLQVAGFRERGLDVVVSDFADSEFGRGKDAALLRQSLRWSLSGVHLESVGFALLPASDQIVTDLDFEGRWHLDEDEAGDEDDDDDDDDNDDWVDPEVVEVFQVIVQVLRELDHEGVFGAGAERERLVLCVWEGDQSNRSLHDYAKKLNPPAVARRFGAEMNLALRVHDQLHHPDAEPREEDSFD